MTRRILLSLLIVAGGAQAFAQNPSGAERFVGTPSETVAIEQGYWERVSLPVPSGIVLEVSGILALPGKRLLVTTRRGEMWWVDGAYDEQPQPKYTLFASGLHEPLGVIAAPKGGYYVAQREEITHITDTDNDGRADRFDTVWKVPIYGNYHEYAFGPVMGPDGNLRVTLNIAFGAPTQSPAPWRGWMMEVTPEGRSRPIAAGLRSPAGFTVTSKGDWFYAENQGEWVGSGHVTHVEPGDFVGHPASLAWSGLTGSTVKLAPEDIPDDARPNFEQAKDIRGMKTPAVWFPHTVLGISTSDIREDVTGGRFGPYSGQFYVGDQGQSKIMRMSLEKVKGVYQGAAYSFLGGFESGIIRLAWGDDGVLFTGETARGWGSVGGKDFALERVRWKGKTPFDLQEVRAQPDGFVLTFTEPVDPVTAADPASYGISGFIYKHHRTYGSSAINKLGCPVMKVVISADRRSVRLGAACLREGYIHEVKARGVRSAAGAAAPLHDTAYYTLNRFPDGDRIVPEYNFAELCVAPVPAAANADTPKHPTTMPKDWANWDEDQTLVVGTLPGLKFDTPLLTTKAGTHLRLVFKNSDDMLHNLVITPPGRGTAVGEAALALGVDGAAQSYVPDSADVLFHTSLLQPGSSDAIFFTAPDKPGDYEFLCTFPGHFQIMRGILRVEPKAAGN
jgi:azurin/glucose/arabinose dehydrogenase